MSYPPKTPSPWPRWASWATAALAALLGLAGAQAASSMEHRRIQDLVDAEVDALAHLLEIQTTTRLRALERMALRQPQDEDRWRADAAHYVEHEAGLKALQIVDPDYRIRWTESPSGHETSHGIHPALEHGRAQALKSAHSIPDVVVSAPVEFPEGGRGTLVLSRFPSTGEVEGYVLAVYSPAELSGISDITGESYCLDLKIGDTALLPPAEDCSDITGTANFDVGGQRWSLQLHATAAWEAQNRDLLPTALGALGLALAAMLGLAVEQAVRSHHKAREAMTMAQHLEERTQELEQSNQDLQHFAYAASHDLNEPVRMVIAFSTRLREQLDERLTDRERRHFGFLQEGAARMQRLLDALMRFSRVQRAEPQMVHVSLHDVAETAGRGVQAYLTERRGSLSFDLEKVEVLADGLLLELALANLLNNALKYSEGAPVVRVSSQREGQRIRVLVSDEGIGIDAQYHPRIFRLFRRLHGPNSTYAGSGIGLSVVQRIAQLHGSPVRIDSRPGQGSTFSFTLEVV